MANKENSSEPGHIVRQAKAMEPGGAPSVPQTRPENQYAQALPDSRPELKSKQGIMQTEPSESGPWRLERDLPPVVVAVESDEESAPIVLSTRKSGTATVPDRPSSLSKQELANNQGTATENQPPEEAITDLGVVIEAVADISSGVVVLDHAKRNQKDTNLGIGIVGGQATPVEENKPTADSAVPRLMDLANGESDAELQKWGPPGATIPPEFRGDQAKVETERIDISAIPTEKAVAVISGPITQITDPQHILNLLHQMEAAGDRDTVIGIFLSFIGEYYSTCSFCIVRGDELCKWKATESLLPLSVRLEESPGLQCMQQSAFPFRKTIADIPGKAFLESLGHDAAITIIQVYIRERLVATYFAGGPLKPCANEYLALLAATTGQRFERLIQAKKQS